MHPLRQRFALIPLLALASSVLILPTGCSRDPNVRKQKYLESGRRYEKDGKYREAVIQFSNALKVDQNFADAHYELGNTFIRMGSMTAGYSELLKTVDLKPSNIKARLDLGNLQLAGGLPEEALKQANAVLAIDGNNAQAFALLANYWQRKGDHNQAMQNINKAISIDPKQSSFHMILASLQSSETPSASTAPSVMQELQRAIDLDKTNSSARLMLAAMLERQHDVAGATAQIKSAIELSPKDLAPREALTGLYMRSGNRPEAEQTLRKTAEDFPDDPTGASLLSSFYLSQGQSGEAESAYADLSGKNPKSVELKLVYAQILGMNHKMDKVRQLTTELNKSAPNNPQVAVLNAGLMVEDKKYKEAQDLLQKAASNNPDNVNLQIALGRMSAQRQDYPAANNAFSAAYRLAPQNLDAATGMADLAEHSRDFTQLIQIADKTLAIQPEFANAYVWRATGEAQIGQLDKAQQDFQTALTKDPQNIPATLAMGAIKVAQKKVPEGTALFEKVLASDPASSAALVELVRVDLSQGHPEQALARVKDQINRAPNAEPLYTLLASLQASARDFAGVRETATKAISLNAEDQQAVRYLAGAETALGNPDGAIAVWQKWLDAHPSDYGADTMIAMLAENKGDSTRAEDFYKKAIALSPGAPTAMASNNLAYLMVQNGQDLDQALQYAQQARQAMPKNPATADTLAWVYFHKGRYSTARDLLETALKDAPNDASVHLHLGMTYGKLNDKANAALHLKKAVALGNGNAISKAANDALVAAS